MDNHSTVKTYGEDGRILEARWQNGVHIMDISFDGPCGATLLYNKSGVDKTPPRKFFSLCESCARERGFIW